MPQTDLPLEELRRYRPELPAPDDLWDFWAATLAEAAERPLDVSCAPVDTGLVTVETQDVSFAGFGGSPVRAWLHLPARALRGEGPLPGVVQYQGYNGGRGLPHEHVLWASAGFAHLVVDTRGQGSGWTVGDTGDPVGSAAAQPGFLTRGVLSPQEYYYRRVYTDATRALEVLRGHPEVDGDRVAVTGVSQGGGIALAVSALAPGVRAVLPDVPFLCDFPRATRIAGGDPYAEVVRYLKAHRDRVDRVFRTLAYFDGAVLGRRSSAPALFSVALMDETCPPSTVFAAYHAYGGPKEIEVYPFNDHEGGEAHQQRAQLAWLRSRLGAPPALPTASAERSGPPVQEV
ncbi:cephalosporin-C deacetylase [Geodermatophilus bullaregiensis]|uniref:acetylxylan esterase n=1 Tax=Geodermatophilus bullaregiensis TaxID=1564160 RepID=UPI001959AD67|nr:acetylxylan esterase [Geodermatophilus bullaregiensis]MBM7804521.1 cephalosporin-C deacetylase [Geodermatophilus bullaregiensis]